MYVVNTFTVFNFHSILTCIKHFSRHPVSQQPVNVSVCVCAGHPDHPSLHQDLQLEQWEHLLPHHHRQPGQRKQTAVWDLTGGWQQHTQLSNKRSSQNRKWDLYDSHATKLNAIIFKWTVFTDNSFYNLFLGPCRNLVHRYHPPELTWLCFHVFLCVHTCRATRWTTCWPPTSVRCSPPWTSSALGGATASELLTGRRPLSSSGSCALLVSTAAGGGPLPTSCGGWAAVLLLAPKGQSSPGKVRLPAATPAKAPATATTTATTWMRTSRPVRMTTSKTSKLFVHHDICLVWFWIQQSDLRVQKHSVQSVLLSCLLLIYDSDQTEVQQPSGSRCSLP